MTHAPRPWERHTSPKGTHIWSGDRHIADVDDHNDGHLIAAAPDMQEALDELIIEMDAVNVPSLHVMGLIRKAAAKAKG